SIKKQNEIDEKIYPHVLAKYTLFSEKINEILIIISEKDKYESIELNGNTLTTIEKENNLKSFIDMEIDNLNLFIESNKMLAGRDLFHLILETDAISLDFYCSLHEYLINIDPIDYYNSEVFKETSKEHDRDKLDYDIKKKSNEVLTLITEKFNNYYDKYMHQ
ncbi:TPA: hypothetical protein I8W54_003307, partial [Morganella morganii]|nr:hypothetical protein [Morganella morganii]